MRDLVVIFEASSPIRIQEIAGLLEEEGFDPVISGTNTNAVFGNALAQFNPTKVMVDSEDEAAARAVLEDYLEGTPVFPPGEVEEE